MNKRGFTIAEIMIALTILGFIGLLTYGAFGNSLDARNRSLAVAERYHEIRQAMARMSREISMAFLSHHRDCDDRRTYTLFREDSGGGGDKLTFTSFSHIKMRKDANESDQNELSYFLETDPKDANIRSLIRRESPRIDDEPDDANDNSEEYVLLENVEELEFEYYNDKDDDWEDDWDSESMDYKNRLPLFVKITLKAKGPHEKVETFVTKTEVFLRKTGASEDAILIFGTGFSRCAD